MWFNRARVFNRGDQLASGPAADLSALLDRIRHRFYVESLPVLSSWWLKTVFYAGHNLVWWGELNTAIGKVLRDQFVDARAAEPIRDIQTWVRQMMLPRHRAPDVRSLLVPPFRRDMMADQAVPYLCRVLNEWLPGEVARLLTTETAFAGSDEDGMPVMAIAKALERLLLREHFSPATLELLLEADWSSPKYAYPAHIEILRDIILALLGRTAAPDLPVLPVTALAGGFGGAVRRALLVSSDDGDELHVPLDEAQTREVFKHHAVRIGSIVVTMDGRCWQSVHLQTGQETVIVYRPSKPLLIDFSSEHARLVVPWPDAETRWPGAIHLPDQIALFGREWRGHAWERSAERTWLHLEFSGVLTFPEMLAPGKRRPRHLRPASSEIPWSAVEEAISVEFH